MHYWRPLLTTALLFVAGFTHAGCNDGSIPGVFVFPSEAATSSFLTQLKTAVSNGDKAQVSRLVAFPFYAQIHGKRVRIHRRNFAPHFSAIFNHKVRSALSSAEFRTQADYTCVFWNASGMMVGDGEIWFNVVASGIKVVAINN